MGGLLGSNKKNMLTNEIIALARQKMLEEGTELITDDTVLIYVNLSYKDIIKIAFPKNSILEADIAFASGEGSLPTLFGTLYTDAFDTDINIFPEVSIADFLRLNGRNGVTIEGGIMKVSPDSTTSLTVKYYPTQPTLTNTVNPTIDEYLHEPMVYGIMYRAYEDLQDTELSEFYKEKFDKMLREKLEVLSNYEEDAQRGGAMFNGINILGGGLNNNNPDRW